MRSLTVERWNGCEKLIGSVIRYDSCAGFTYLRYILNNLVGR